MLLLSKIKIVGHSMEPTLKSGNLVLISSLPYLFKNPTVGDLVVLRKEKYIIKRINKIDGNRSFVIGDNKKASTDSRSFGWVNLKEIVGKVILKM